MCSYAVDQRFNNTRLFCMVENILRTLSFTVFSLNTRGSAEELESLVASGEAVMGRRSLNTNSVPEDFAALEFTAADLHAGNSRLAVTHSLDGDNRFFLIPSGSRNIYQLNFGANFESNVQLEEGLAFGPNVLYSAAATQQDYVNLGCS